MTGNLLVVVVTLLMGLGVFTLSAFRAPAAQPLHESFLIGAAFGLIALFITARVVSLDALRHFRYLEAIAALTLGILLLTVGTGPRGTGTRINLFGVFQPVEFIKILAVLFLASYLAARDTELRRLDAVWRFGVSLPRLCDIAPVLMFVLAALAMFFLQKDLGPALVLYLVFVGMFVIASGRVGLALGGLIALLAIFWATYRFELFPTVFTRIEMWLSPWDNHRPGGVQLAESLWALASGGTWGSGIQHAEIRYIPAGHTDLILAAIGETLGLPGVLTALTLLALAVATLTVIAARAASSYGCYLAYGLALLVGIEAALLAAGTVGLVPLTGIPMPFLSYGKSATVAYFLLVGLALNVSRQATSAVRIHARLPMSGVVIVSLVLASIVLTGWQAARLMTMEADSIVARGALTPQADGVRRFSYNRRLLDFAAGLPRGRVLDRGGVALATDRTGRRIYPLGPYAAQVIGHPRPIWADPRTVERARADTLRGYALSEKVVKVDGRATLTRDYSALMPAFRARFDPDAAPMIELREQNRDVGLTLDAALQAAAARALARYAAEAGSDRGAAVVLDAASGAILAAASLPTYDPNVLNAATVDAMFSRESRAALDRTRFEIYPPGSTFKLATAVAALERSHPSDAPSGQHECRHTDEASWQYGGREYHRRVTDDEQETAHGVIGMGSAIVESCNVYFAWLGTRLGAHVMYEALHQRLGLALPEIPSADVMAEHLADHAYGQGRVTVTPIEMARLAAVIANGGREVTPILYLDELSRPGRRASQVISPSTALQMQEWMIEAVQSGTGRRAAVDGLVVGGKTGTAQTESGSRRSHAWFVGFAFPAGGSATRAIAFAFLVENGGYGGRVAAPAAQMFLKEGYLSLAAPGPDS